MTRLEIAMQALRDISAEAHLCRSSSRMVMSSTMIKLTASALAAIEKAPGLADIEALIQVAAKAISETRNDPKYFTNGDLAQAALRAVDAHQFGGK